MASLRSLFKAFLLVLVCSVLSLAILLWKFKYNLLKPQVTQNIVSLGPRKHDGALKITPDSENSILNYASRINNGTLKNLINHRHKQEGGTVLQSQKAVTAYLKPPFGFARLNKSSKNDKVEMTWTENTTVQTYLDTYKSYFEKYFNSEVTRSRGPPCQCIPDGLG